MTERGELLRVFSVYELAEELGGKKISTMHPTDQFFLGVARARLCLGLGPDHLPEDPSPTRPAVAARATMT